MALSLLKLCFILTFVHEQKDGWTDGKRTDRWTDTRTGKEVQIYMLLSTSVGVYKYIQCICLQTIITILTKTLPCYCHHYFIYCLPLSMLTSIFSLARPFCTVNPQ